MSGWSESETPSLEDFKDEVRKQGPETRIQGKGKVCHEGHSVRENSLQR